MSVQWHPLRDAVAAAEAAAHFILGRLEDALDGQPYTTLVLSGGSGPRAMFAHLAAARFSWNRVHFFWVDERCVPPDHPNSNFRLAKELLLGPAHITKTQVHRIAGELRPEEAARRYVEDIREFFELEVEALPHFDVVHLGLGADGHTASLFPGEPLLDDRSAIAAAVYVEKLNSWRVTLLPGALLAAGHTMFLSTGEDKADAVHAVLTEPYDPRRWPAQVITHHGRRVAWFLDHAAARKEA
jgi:6-phosphogluconolactonase